MGANTLMLNERDKGTQGKNVMVYRNRGKTRLEYWLSIFPLFFPLYIRNKKVTRGKKVFVLNFSKIEERFGRSVKIK